MQTFFVVISVMILGYAVVFGVVMGSYATTLDSGATLMVDLHEADMAVRELAQELQRQRMAHLG